MSRQNYSYSTTAAAATPRQMSNHGTSSAFSSSANPDEDWTKISDLAERRRIQNRIAQRNYRKKLKRRLEDLERRAGSSSASPPQTHAEIQQQQPARQQAVPQYNKRSPEVRQQQVSPRLLPSQYTPPMESEDMMFHQQGFERDGSRTPPLFAYHSYPAPEEVSYPYPQSQPYRPVQIGDWSRGEADYLVPAPVTLPPMMAYHDSAAIKREHEAETMQPYNMSYHGLPAIDIHGAHGGYGDSSDPTTPPLSHSYEHSTCSEIGYQYPTTPMSMPPSPPLVNGL